MNAPIYDHIINERTREILRSIEFFVGIIVVAIVVSFVCLSVA